MKHLPALLGITIVVLLLSACEPAEPISFDPVDWYIALDGDDDNSCQDASDACATLAAALTKAEAENRRLAAEHAGAILPTHIFHIAAGTYLWSGSLPGYPMAAVLESAVILGAGEGSTILDGASTYGGIFITGDGEVTIRDLTIQNVRGSAPDSCINVRGTAAVTIQDVTVTNCGETGITHLSPGLLMIWRMTSTDNAVGDQGIGAALYGPAIIVDSTFSNNAIFGVTIRAEVTISDSIVSENGHAGVHVLGGHVTLNHMTLNDNDQAGAYGTGLKMVGDAEVTVTGGTMAENFYGVWLRESGSTAALYDVTIENNHAAGVLVATGAEARLLDSMIRNNGGAFGGRGGGIYLEGGDAEVHRSTVRGNQRGGVWVVLEGEALISESLISENLDEFTVYIGEDATATVQRSQIDNSLVTDRTALESLGTLTLINSTVSGSAGTGVRIVEGDATISHSTLAENGGYGLRVFVSDDVSVTLTNNLVAKNDEADCFAVVEAGVTLDGTNIDTDGTCGFPASYAPADLLLDVLADNGGPTWTHALMLDSPAIDAGGPSCPSEDQRNMARPLGAGCDVGAYESSSMAMSLGEEESDSEAPTATPTPSEAGTLTVVPEQSYNCRYGNGSAFDIADTLVEGEIYHPIGIGIDGLWLQFNGPTYGELCWALTEGFTLFLDGIRIDLSALPQNLLEVVAYPDIPPTATPTPDPDESYDITATPTCTPQQIQNQQCP